MNLSTHKIDNGQYWIQFINKDGKETRWPVPEAMSLCHGLQRVFDSNEGKSQLVSIEYKVTKKRSTHTTFL